MAKKSFKAQLKAGSKAWAESSDMAKALGKVEAGEYIAKLGSAELKQAQSSGNLMIARKHVITEGDMEGKQVFDNLLVETPQQMAFVRKWFESIDAEVPESLEGVEELVSEINDEGYTAKINVKVSGDFTNVSILELLDGDDADEDSDEEDEDSEDEEEETEDEDEDDDSDTEDEEEVDLDELDKKGLLKLIKEEDIDIKNAKKMSEKKLRKAIEEAISEDDEAEEEEESDSEEDELLERAEKFCIAQDLDYDEDDFDIDDLKEAISEETYKKKDLDSDDVALLTELGLKKLIKGKKK